MLWLISYPGYVLSNNFWRCALEVLVIPPKKKKKKYLGESFYARRLWLCWCSSLKCFCLIIVQLILRNVSTYSLYAVLDSSIVDCFKMECFVTPFELSVMFCPSLLLSLSLFSNLSMYIFIGYPVYKSVNIQSEMHFSCYLICDVNVPSVVESFI